jgi:DNA-binding XRE family transcriptional regulator
LNGKRYVIVDEKYYHLLERLATKTESEPSLPPKNAKGNYPAAEALTVSIARDIIRRRRAAELSQAELARRAGIRPETVNRIEGGKHAPSIATVEKIDAALSKAEGRKHGGKGKSR